MGDVLIGGMINNLCNMSRRVRRKGVNRFKVRMRERGEE
jgi:hypothetical protein